MRVRVSGDHTSYIQYFSTENKSVKINIRYTILDNILLQLPNVILLPLPHVILYLITFCCSYDTLYYT